MLPKSEFNWTNRDVSLRTDAVPPRSAVAAVHGAALE